jgi:hypothetical protein
MKNSKHIHTISSTLKTVASENLVTEEEIANAEDKPLKEILNDKENQEKPVSPNSERS